MRYLTDEEIVENRGKLVPAQFDEKNLTTDWITYDLPDYGTTAGVRQRKSKTEVVMWINGDPILVCFFENKITFYKLLIFMDINYIEKCIEELVGKTEGLVCNKRVRDYGNSITFCFFWECGE